MSPFGLGFLVGVFTAALTMGLYLVLTHRWKGKQFEEVEVPDKPVPSLTDQEKERIREEIAADANAALARRFLTLLSRSRDRDGEGGKNGMDHP